MLLRDIGIQKDDSVLSFECNVMMDSNEAEKQKRTGILEGRWLIGYLFTPVQRHKTFPFNVGKSYLTVKGLEKYTIKPLGFCEVCKKNVSVAY